MWLTALILLYMPQDMSFNSSEKMAQEYFYRYYFDPSRDNPDIDVLNYDLNFEFEGVESTVGTGDARLTIRIVNPEITKISLDFRNECTVDQVLVNAEETSFNHGATKLTINLPNNPGDTILARVIYRIPSRLSAGVVAENWDMRIGREIRVIIIVS